MDLRKGAWLAVLLVVVLSINFLAGAVNAKSYGIMEASKEVVSLSNFSAALQQTGLADTLNNKGILVFGNLSYLVFAPNDAAFANMTIIDLKANETDLKRVVRYHIVCGSCNPGDLTNGTSLQTLQGENLSVTTNEGLTINGGKVLKTKKYDNGTIYVIEKVLIPKSTTGSGMGVIEAAKAMGLNKFAEAVQNASFADRLNGQGVLGIGALAKEGPFTIFAPSDQALANVPPAVTSAIMGKNDSLRTLLSYHVVDRISAVNRTKIDNVKTLEGTSQAIDTKEGIVGGARILKAQRYDNGIIYEIDQVLIPMKLSMSV
jgi:transforming growth factor-beta-induced protein